MQRRLSHFFLKSYCTTFWRKFKKWNHHLMLLSFHWILRFFIADCCTVMPKSRAYCWVCGERPMSSLGRSPPKDLGVKHPDSPMHGKIPKWCYLGECRALGEARQASKAADDRETKLMAEKAAAPSTGCQAHAPGPRHHLEA